MFEWTAEGGKTENERAQAAIVGPQTEAPEHAFQPGIQREIRSKERSNFSKHGLIYITKKRSRNIKVKAAARQMCVREGSLQAQ